MSLLGFCANGSVGFATDSLSGVAKRWVERKKSMQLAMIAVALLLEHRCRVVLAGLNWRGTDL